MTTTTPESRGQIAYTAYGRVTGYKSIHGEDLPPWLELSQEIREAWITSAGVIWDLATTGHATL